MDDGGETRRGQIVHGPNPPADQANAVGDADTAIELEAQVRTERALAICFFAIRSVHLGQGAICTVRATRSYRRPRLATVTLLLSTIESAWLFGRWTRGKRPDAWVSWVDTAFGLCGLAAIGAATEPRDRTTSVNWMLPYTVGTGAGTALGLARRRERVAASGALAAAYAATTWRDLRGGGPPAATAIANVASYGGFTAVVDVVAGLLRRHARELERAKHEAVEHAAQLGEARERDRQHRFLHDSALQTLEALLRDWNLDDATLRARVRHDATTLRNALRGEPGDDGATLQGELTSVASESAALGLRVELVVDELPDDPPRATVRALCDATRETLANVAKHAGTSDVVVRVMIADGGMRVTVRDHGAGFDTAAVRPGFGLRQSVIARMNEVGGSAEVWSERGRGTRITIWAPT